ncbi:MAG: nucleoid-associated protein [Bacteroidota bacterium]
MKESLDFSLLHLKNVIVHDIPKHSKHDSSLEPIYSEAETALSNKLKTLFKTKINNALSSDKTLKVCFDENTSAPMPTLIKDIIRKNINQFVLISKEMGTHLYNSQNGLNPAGILLIMHGHINMLRCCVIMKLDRDSGAQLKINDKTKSIDIEQVEDLMLTEKSKVFKIGVFFDRGEVNFNYDGFVADFQNNMKSKANVKSQFIEQFLGCFPFDDPSISTKKFYELTKEFIFLLPDKLSQAKYLQDLNSYVQKNITLLNPRDFAEDYLITSKERDDYKNYLAKNEFSFQSFPKNNTLISTKIKKITMVFANGISLTGDKGTFDKKVIITKTEDGHEAKIRSRIQRVD